MKIFEQMSFWDLLPPEERPVWEEVATLKNQVGNLRRGIFARHDKLEKEIASLKKEIRSLKGKTGRGKRGKAKHYQADFFEGMR